jgi:hypothetical protein
MLHIFRQKVLEAALCSNGSLPLLPESVMRRRLSESSILAAGSEDV